MGTIANPFGDLLQGILQGHAIAHTLRQQAMQEEAFQRSQQRDAEESQIRSLTLQQQLDSLGRRVIPGTNAIPESFQASSMSPIPGVPDATQTISSMRPVDKSRLLTFKDPASGQTMQWESYTPEERLQQRLSELRETGMVTAQTAGLQEITKKRMEQQFRDAQLRVRGVDAPQAFVQVGMAQPGERFLPEELRTMLPEYQKLVAPQYKEIPEGGSLYQLPTMNPLAPAAAPQPQADTTPVMPGISTSGRTSFLPGNEVTAQSAREQLAAAAAPGQQARQDFVTSTKAAGAPSTPTLVVAGKPKQTSEEDALDAYAASHFKQPDGTPMTSRKDMNALQNAAARSWFKATNADQETRAAALAAKASAEAARAESAARGQAAQEETATRNLDRQIKQYGDPYQKMLTGTDAQLDKVLDAEKLLAGGAMGQALGIPKILTALVSGQGSGVRITQSELNSIAHARGIAGDVEGWFNRLSGQGTLTKAQKDQMQGLLNDVRTRLVQKKAIASSVLDEMNSAQSREDVMKAEKRGRAALGGGAAGTGTVHYVDQGVSYDIPADRADAFLAAHPKATKGN